MKILKFKKIDAFTKGLSSGNPAGYVLLEDNTTLTESDMQSMASELKGYVNEVGYARRVGDTFNLKFYSSECEVAFCGHATIAIMYDLLCNTRDLLVKKEVFINVTAGKLPVFNRIAEEDAVYIMAPAPKVQPCHFTASALTEALGTVSSAIDVASPVEVIDGGLRTLLVSMKTLEACIRLSPDPDTLRVFCLDNDVDIVHVSTKETRHAHCAYHCRVFAPKYGYLEDPATGSGNAAFGYYLIRQGLWKKRMTVAQGPDPLNPNFVKLDKQMVEGVERVLFGGCGTTRIKGQYYLHTHG